MDQHLKAYFLSLSLFPLIELLAIHPLAELVSFSLEQEQHLEIS